MRQRYFIGLIAVVGVTSRLWAQRGRGGGPLYDVKSEVKITGTVQEVQQFSGRSGGTGTHLVLSTDAGTLDVHVGPTAYIAQQQFSFAKGDSIEVLGSKINLSGTDTLLAREITKGGKTLSLRDKDGFPLWSGRGRGGIPN